MNTNIIEAREFIAKAREALKSGDKESARDLGEKAALLAPDLEDAWLVLTAADSNPEDALAYAQKALELNPASVRARKGVEWAMGKLKQAQLNPEPNLNLGTPQANASRTASVYDEAPTAPPIKREAQKSPPPAAKKSSNRNLLIGAGVLGLIICIILAAAAWWAFNNGVFSSFLPSNSNVPANEAHWAQVSIPKPSVTPIDVNAFAQPTSLATQPPPVAMNVPASISTEVPTLAPTAIPTQDFTATPEVTETPGVMAMDIIADTPTSVYVPPTNAPNAPPVVASGNHGGARWIDVNLSTQSVYAYEGDTVVNSFIVSTGTSLHPTVTGKFKIWIKLKSTDMSGPGYYLPNVPYVMYFYKGYGLHGTYWHSNFGTPMSHGCVNLRTSDAEWLYYWASEGTVVNVHY
ncbi:MAG: L,D-transpeptidase family protein [Chloroflexota bacterium]